MYRLLVRRTQIYLDEAVWERVERLTEGERRSMSEVVRAALDRYLDEQERARRPLALAAPAWVGAWSQGQGPDLEAVRREFDERASRLGY